MLHILLKQHLVSKILPAFPGEKTTVNDFLLHYEGKILDRGRRHPRTDFTIYPQELSSLPR